MPVWARKPRTSRAKSRRRSVSQLTKLGKNFKRAKSSVLCYLFYWSSQKIVLCPTHTGNSNHWIDDSNTNLIQKHPHKHRQNNTWPNIWASHGPVKLTNKISHHMQWFIIVSVAGSLMKPEFEYIFMYLTILTSLINCSCSLFSCFFFIDLWELCSY